MNTGRPKNLKLREIVKKAMANGISLNEIAKRTGHSYSTIHRIKKELGQKNET